MSEETKPSQKEKMDPLIRSTRELREIYLADPHRPWWHFIAPEGVCIPFDPDGAIFWNGRYHLGYIFCDERGPCWGHASSKDMAHWRWHCPMLVPGEPDKGIFSGNCFVNKQGQPTVAYHGCEVGNCFATSDDPDLDHWTKFPKPYLAIPAEGSEEASRYGAWDPHVWLEGDTYYAISGANPVYAMAGKGHTTVFRANDLDHWEFIGPLLSHQADDVEACEDISCPDLFKLGDKHVLLCISHLCGCRYYVGDWDGRQFHMQLHRRMNWPGGSCFAPETLLDDQGRRIMWAWALPNVLIWDTNQATWSGVMTLPRILTMGDDDTLRIDPVPELEMLRARRREHKQIAVPAGQPMWLEGVAGNSFEMQLTITPGACRKIGMKLFRSPDGREESVVTFDLDAKTITVDFSKSTLDTARNYQTYCLAFGRENPPVTQQQAPFELADGEKLELRIFADRSIVEIFANRRQCVTQRLYPTLRESTGIEFFAENGSYTIDRLEMWDMEPANPW